MILRTIARALIQEHRYRPITGRILCLGPQLVPMHRGEVDELFAETAAAARAARAAWQRDGADPTHVSDEYFFHKFPIDRLDSLDVVEGFGGTVIHNLNDPVPDELRGQFDFIVDGGTFDHLLQIGTAFGSVVDLLKPGGRVLHWNAASGYLGAAYVSFGADLFFDYYVVNAFADCRVYVMRNTGTDANDPWDVYYLPTARTKALNRGITKVILCLAEKAEDSTSTELPVEYGYRPPDLRETYEQRRIRMLHSRRPVLQCDRSLVAGLRETVIRTKLETQWAIGRRRAGKFTRRAFARARRLHSAGTGYVYLGRL